ncbi:hypothetical protein [Nocardia terpenica]|uniref:Scaffolding protein n=1 Tax=Nocardia terpenica TaxID=455432 RepID=A0A164LB85_9NOCA|nr:hypothetical protein [Nocardia terpenica]KZM72213.1 hypothetical protein AWN90_36665 [Nocardia terpenica]NQE86643.1 hypothetical protein [Nocardia terpenica]
MSKQQRADTLASSAPDDVTPDDIETVETAPEAGESDGVGEEQAVNKHGYPDNTPLTEMTVEQQAAYWKAKARMHESRSRAKAGGLSAEEADALRNELQELRDAQLSETERAQQDAIESAREAGRSEARDQLMPMLHEAQLRGYASTVIKGAKLDGFVSTVNITAFSAEDGSIDGEKVVAHLKAMYGEEPPSSAAASTYPNFGQGSPGATSQKSTRADGLAEAKRRGFSPAA